jgi:hypothetical protein
MDTDEIIEAIDQEILRLEKTKALLAEDSGSGPAKATKPGRTLSAAGRGRIVAAQNARWAKPGRSFSAAARARIVAGQKARWAKVKKAAK